ncbi:hypothetical protein [Penaeicola halotolerans]|uniref:hypothetical protein n=1 Tax=Penaeicola halotolerans TaxID=2793196 RepID=UPI001CF7FFAB|nr:hypothetical protein [Penaeicola halotolerans]
MGFIPMFVGILGFSLLYTILTGNALKSQRKGILSLKNKVIELAKDNKLLTLDKNYEQMPLSAFIQEIEATSPTVDIQNTLKSLKGLRRDYHKNLNSNPSKMVGKLLGHRTFD